MAIVTLICKTTWPFNFNIWKTKVFYLDFEGSAHIHLC